MPARHSATLAQSYRGRSRGIPRGPDRAGRRQTRLSVDGRWPSPSSAITSNFTFLTGGSHPQEYALRAIELGLPAFAIADRNSVAGLVRAHQELREAARGGARGAAALARRPALPRRRARADRAAARPRRLGPALPAADARGAPRREGRLPAARSTTSADLGELHLLLHPPAGRAASRGWLPQARALAAARTATPISSRARATTARTAPARPRWRGWPASSGCRSSPRPSRSCTTARRRRLVDVLTCIRDGLPHRRDRPRRARQRRAAAALGGRDAAALRRPRGGGAPRRRDRRGLPLPRSTSCATSTRRRSGTARTRRRGSSG